MKLHLPKQLFTALLTAITLAAAPTALTLGSAAWGAAETIETTTTWDGDVTKSYETGDYLKITGSNTTLTLDGASITGGAVMSLTCHGVNVIVNNGSNVEIGRLVTHDSSNAAATSENVTVNTGGVLTITDSDTGSGNFWTAVLLGHWGGTKSTALNVDGGQLNVLNGTVQLGYSSAGQLNITDGEANIKKINARYGTLTLTGGRLNIGAGGVINNSGNTTGQQAIFQSGTLGVLSVDGWTLDGNVSTTIGQITIDTNVYTPGSAVGAGTSGVGANVSLLGDLIAASDSASITLSGSGSVTLNHTWDGSLNLTDGATAKVYLQDINNFDAIGYVDATGNVSTSGFVNEIRVSNSTSEFYDNKVYIGENAYTVTSGVAKGVYMLYNSVFYVNEELAYNATTMAGATAFNVSANNTLTFNGGTHSYNALQGSGNVAIKNQGVVTVSTPLDYEGSIEIDGAGSALKLSGSGGSTILNLLLNDGGKLIFLANTNAYTHTFSNVKVNGSGGIYVSSSNNTYWQTCINIENLTNAIDDEGNVIEGTLTLESEYRNSPRNVFNLNGGDFAGTINFYATSSQGARKHALNINNSTAAKNAVINISNSLNSNVTMALGIGANEVTVKGITGGTDRAGIYSGSQAFGNSNNFASDSTRRTLIIDTPADDAVAGGYSTVVTVGSNLNLVKKGEGSQAFTGNMSAFNGIIDVQAGTLTIGAADGSTATKLGLGGTISNAGTLNLYTNATANDSNLFDVKSVTGITDAGFAADAATATYLLVSGSGAVTLKNDAKLTINGVDYALTKNQSEVTFSAAAATDTYYVLTGATTSGALAAATDAGKTLGKIHIAESGTLSYDSGALNNVTLNGSGTYKLASSATALTSGVTLGECWTGTVLINGTGDGTNLENFNTLGATTRLGFEGASGYLWTSNNNTGKLKADLFLRNGSTSVSEYAIKLNNGSSDANADVELSGKITGGGDIWYTFAGNKNAYTATHTFSGDLSDWNGEFIRKAGATSGKTVIAKFTSGGNVFQANGTGGVSDADNSGRLKVTIDAADGSTTTFNGSITNAAQLNVNTDTIFTAGLTSVGTVNVATGKHMTVRNGLSATTISLADSASALIFDNSSDVTASGAIAGTGAVTKQGAGVLTLSNGSSFTGDITVQAGTLKAGGEQSHTYFGADYSTNKTRRVILEAGAKLDVNGTESYYHVVLGEGATIANSGDAVDTGWRALPHVELAGDAFFDATSQIVMQKGNIDSGGTYKLDLNGYTLTKTGSNNAVLINVGIGAGTVKVQDGGFKLSSGVTLDTITGVNFSLVGNAQKTGTLITDVVATAKDVTFDGGMVQVGSNKSLTATGKTMVKSAGGTLSGSMIAHNQVSMEEGAALKVGTSAAAGSLKVQSATDSGKYVTISGAANTSASVTAKSDSALIQMAQDASFTIADMTLTNTSISAAETTTRVNLSNVSVAENSVATLAKGAFAVQNQATVGTGGGEVDFTTSSYSGFTLGSAESAASITLNLGDLSQVKRMGPGVYESITILLEDFHMTEGNASIFFAADSWLGQLLSSQGANAYVSGSLDAPASVSEGGSSVSVSYSAATGDNVGTIITITGLNVPEPTTSTLSLLALAALAARRRRK